MLYPICIDNVGPKSAGVTVRRKGGGHQPATDRPHTREFNHNSINVNLFFFIAVGSHLYDLKDFTMSVRVLYDESMMVFWLDYRRV
jgi:hypothetical protein